MENTENSGRVKEDDIGMFKRMRATFCHHCPLCSHARKSPDSMIGKILHHRYHADNCPMWKAEKEVYGDTEMMNHSDIEVRAHSLWKAL